jgi:hypothetical protein
MFVLGSLSTAESRQMLHSSSGSQSEEGRALVAGCNDSMQYPELEMFVLDCLAADGSRQRLHSSYKSQSEEGRELVA